jgi:hypothetical protein
MLGFEICYNTTDMVYIYNKYIYIQADFLNREINRELYQDIKPR